MWRDCNTIEEMESAILGAFAPKEMSILQQIMPIKAIDKAKKQEVADEAEEVESATFMIDSHGDQNVLELCERMDDALAPCEKPVDHKKSHLPAQDHEALLKEWSHLPTELQVPERKEEPGTSKSKEPEVMKKSVLTPGFEKKHSVPPYSEGKKAMARKRRQEKATTKEGWFDMKAPEMTEELEADIEAMQMRGSTASWSAYKKKDHKNTPKFFQIATVEDSPLDFYHSRIPRKERKRTIVDELLADAEFRKSNKKQYIKAAEKLNKRHPNKKGGRHKKAKRV